ncbi:MAG: hypothetical protein ACREFQ_17270, partial [Stellaceae bacterium]
RGVAPERFLDAYMAERGPSARATIVESMRVGQHVNERDPEKVKARDEQLLAMQAAKAHRGAEKQLIAFRVPGYSAGFIARGDALAAGDAFPQAAIRGEGERRGRFDDIAGRGFLILARGANPWDSLPEPQRALWQSLGGKVVHLAPAAGPGAVVDIEGRYAALMDAYGAEVIVKRPDHNIFGACRSMAELPALLADLGAQIRTGETVQQ